jgi:hypothetical protein
MPSYHLTRRAARWPLAAAAVVAFAPIAGHAQSGASPREILAKETYVRPSAEIERIVTAPWYTNVTLGTQSPDRKYFLVTRTEGMPTVQEFGKPHYYLAGLQVDYRANRARVLTTRGAVGLQLIDAK